MEESPAYDPASNGGVERAVRSIKEVVRTLKSDVESKTQITLKMDLAGDRNIIAWMAEYAGTLLRIYHVRMDGITAYEHLKGRASRRMIVPFAESVLWRPLRDDGKTSNLEAKVEIGFYLGLRDSSDEAIIYSSEGGLTKCRDILRRPWSERWDISELRAIQSSPCEPNPGTGDMRILTTSYRQRPVQEKAPGERSMGETSQVRRMQITTDDLEKFGYTTGLPKAADQPKYQERS